MRVVKNYMGMMQQIVSSSTTLKEIQTQKKLWFKKIDENSGPRLPELTDKNQFLKQLVQCSSVL